MLWVPEASPGAEQYRAKENRREHTHKHVTSSTHGNKKTTLSLAKVTLKYIDHQVFRFTHES